MKWLAAILLAFLAFPALAQRVPVAEGEVVWARYIEPTDRYDHQVFGDAPLWGGLEISVNTCIGCAGFRMADIIFTLPPDRVFEDLEPRAVDLDGDDYREVVVVETDMARGATLAIYDARGKRAATLPVGQTHRWLAPAGIGDFDGDGHVEIAYVDRPHLARELVFLRYRAGVPTELARAPGFTNHRFGEGEILGGVKSCAGGEALILASADLSRVLSVTLAGGRIVSEDLGPLTSDDDLRLAMVCG